MILWGGMGGGSCGVSIGGAPSIAGVERRSRRFHFAQMRFGPVPHAAKGLAQALAERGQAIFDLGRDDRVNLAMNQPVALHRAQRLSQHLLADARNELGEAGEEIGSASCRERGWQYG